MKKLAMALVSLSAVACLSVPVLAADKTDKTQSAGTAGTQAAGLTAADKTFMTDAASAGMMEVELGRVAQQKGSAQAVKDFGKRMQTDHQKVNDELKAVASKNNFQLPTQMNSKHKMLVDRLSTFSGAQFDKKYMAVMVQDHKEDLGKFVRIQKKVREPELKKFVDNTVPVLEQHLQLAMQTAQQAGVQMKSGAHKPAEKTPQKPETQKK